MEPYKSRDWLYAHYITKKMGLKKIVEVLEKDYGIKITMQTAYNWLERYDLLKLKGKGRKKAKYQGALKQPTKSKTGGVYAKRPRPKRPKPPWMK